MHTLTVKTGTWIALIFAFFTAGTRFLAPAHAAAQTLLVDTGQPIGTFGPLLCSTACGGGSTFQNLAGQFTLSSANSISSAQLWVQAPSTGGQLAVIIRADSAGLPGTGVFSQTYTVPNQTSSGWVTFTFTNQPVLDANTPYWLSFEPVVGSAISYNVTEGAPNPLALYSLCNSLNSGPFTEALALGMRISGTAAEAPSLLVDTGTPTGPPTYSIEYNGSNFEYNAGQFVLSQAASIQAINGYMQVYYPGSSLNVKIYSGNAPLYNNIAPGTAIFSQTYTLKAGNAGWISFPLAEPYPILAAGTYWISFEALPGFFAEENDGVPNPLPNYAYLVNGNLNWVNQPLDVGIQVLGTSLPPASYGTAGRAIMTGSSFGIGNTPQDQIAGGDG